MNFNQFLSLNEAKNFKKGETWEWHTVEWDPKRQNNFKVVKKVEIRDIESNGDVIGRIVGTPDEFIVRDASKYLKKKVNESEEVSEGKYSKDQLLKLISKLDDAEIIVKGKPYIIYNPDNGNDDNTAMWGKDTIKALNSDGDEFEFKYSDIQQFNESEEVSEASKFGAPAGLSKAETKKVAETLAKAISKNDGVKCTVNLKTLEEDSFDLDIDGEEYDGGSYNIYDDGSVVNHAVTPNEIYGKSHSSVEDFIKGLKKPVKESLELNEGAVKQFEKDFADMVQDIKHGVGWIDPEYVETTWDNQSDTIDFDLVKAEIYNRLIKAGLLYHSGDDDEKGKQIKSLKELGIKESVEVNESKITLKRQYTNNHPARTVGKHAAIRNKIIEALKDGELTKEDFDQLVSGLTEDSKRWLRRNAEFFNIGEDKVTLSKNGQRILKSITTVTETIENKNTNMENKFIFESFSEFVEHKLNEEMELIAEAFKSAKLSGIMDLNKMDAKTMKGIYNFTKVKLDQITDDQIIEMTPAEAYKSKVKGIYFYISDVQKQNPYAGESSWSDSRVIPANTLLAVANEKNEMYAIEYARYGNREVRATNVGKYSSDGIGVNKRSGKYDSNLYNIKRISEVADRVLMFDPSILPSSETERSARAAAKKGAIAFVSDKDFKKQNLERYQNILATRAANDDIDGLVKSAIEELTDQIKAAVNKSEFGQYGEILIGRDPKGREVRISDASSIMSKILGDYSRYVEYKNTAATYTAQGERSSYYDKEAANYAKSLKDRANKIKKFDYAW